MLSKCFRCEKIDDILLDAFVVVFGIYGVDFPSVGRSARSLDTLMKEKDANSPKCFHLLRIIP